MINIRLTSRAAEGSCNSCQAHPLTTPNAPEEVFTIALGNEDRTTTFRLCPACFEELHRSVNANMISVQLIADMKRREARKALEQKADNDDLRTPTA